MDEQSANEQWCYMQIEKIKKTYLLAYEHMKAAVSLDNNPKQDGEDTPKSKEYEIAWNKLDCCDMYISDLIRNYCIRDHSIEEFNIYVIRQDIKRLIALFPYTLFWSREMLIKKETCSICGAVVNVRKPCGHVKGKLYMGKMAMHKVEEAEFVGVSIVRNPFDAYCILKQKGQIFDFGILDFIVPMIKPYSAWSYKVIRKGLFFGKNGRNTPCPCGSGFKYKHCIKKFPEIHYIYDYEITIGDKYIVFEKSWRGCGISKGKGENEV